jgi:hypothetical protein
MTKPALPLNATYECKRCWRTLGSHMFSISIRYRDGRNRDCKECCVHLVRVYSRIPTKSSMVIPVNSYHNRRELALRDSLEGVFSGVHVPSASPTALKLSFSQLRIEIHRGDIRLAGYDLPPTTSKGDFVEYAVKVLEEHRTRLDEIYV